MARMTITTGKLGGERVDDLRAAIAGVDGVRSVRDAVGALEVEYDDTLVGKNKLIEVSREHDADAHLPAAAAPPGTGMGPTR